MSDKKTQEIHDKLDDIYGLYIEKLKIEREKLGNEAFEIPTYEDIERGSRKADVIAKLSAMVIGGAPLAVMILPGGSLIGDIAGLAFISIYVFIFSKKRLAELN
ncbi:hypothetical protein [Photobacterium kishitanii]|uniref:Uncharacterized protein n=1 Tax=Photobacterium kishitanii TaxID=318456 RepID=A0A2T3KMB4_9GAMM|nr:hypothetical protein [Photobacterium kishitanii]PSV00947.1 hypothetical protein C9J27_02675 [Photobacterium kishitanii]